MFHGMGTLSPLPLQRLLERLMSNLKRPNLLGQERDLTAAGGLHLAHPFQARQFAARYLYFGANF